LFGTNPDGVCLGHVTRNRRSFFDQGFKARALAAKFSSRLRRWQAVTPKGGRSGRMEPPTTDPKEALAGAQLPFGGFKGSNIALMVELLAGPLLGGCAQLRGRANETKANTGAPCGGELIIAIDPVRCIENGNRNRPTSNTVKCCSRKMLEQEGGAVFLLIVGTKPACELLSRV